MVYKTLGLSNAAAYNILEQEFGDRYNQEELRKHTKDYFEKYYDENTIPVKNGLYILLDYLRDINSKMILASSSQWEVEKHLKSAIVSDYN